LSKNTTNIAINISKNLQETKVQEEIKQWTDFDQTAKIFLSQTFRLMVIKSAFLYIYLMMSINIK